MSDQIDYSSFAEYQKSTRATAVTEDAVREYSSGDRAERQRSNPAPRGARGHRTSPLRRTIAVPLFVLFATVLAGCSGPTDATDANFARALQEYFDANECPGILRQHRFPYMTFFGRVSELDALVVAGLLDIGRQFDQREYTLTSAGSALAQPFLRENDEEGTAFCYASAYRVVEVTDFTVPAAMSGLMVSRVDYTFEIVDVADWVLEYEWALRPAFDDLDRDMSSLDEPMPRRALLVLTNDGWRFEDDIE